jgi:hypothetical protein
MGMITKSKTGRDKTLSRRISFASFYFLLRLLMWMDYMKRTLSFLLLLLAAVLGQLPTPQCLQMPQYMIHTVRRPLHLNGETMGDEVIYKKFSNGVALPESRGPLHLKHSSLLAKLCSLHPDLWGDTSALARSRTVTNMEMHGKASLALMHSD